MGVKYVIPFYRVLPPWRLREAFERGLRPMSILPRGQPHVIAATYDPALLP